MEHVLCLFLVLTSASVGSGSPELEEYLKTRELLLAEELSLSFGWHLSLSVEEEAFNSLLMEEKDKEMQESFNTAKFPPSFSFLETWPDYDNSTVFNMLKTIPKGGILHIHDISMTSIDWLINNATYRDNLYFNQTDESVEFKFKKEAEPGWESVADARTRTGAVQFDKWIRSKLMMGVDQERYETINDQWKKFTSCLVTAFGIITYKPVFGDYFEQALKEYLQDGVQYVEFRTTLPEVYELEGPSLTPLEVAALYKEREDKFAAENPDWCGSKLIFAPIRHVSESTVVDDLKTARQLSAQFPHFFAGFDLVAQEDLGKPLMDFIEPLLDNSPYLTYFFHAGETDWDWSSTDLNLADAILLNTSRIGHGYAIDKHPKLLELARQRDIPIEVNPISNQVLGLVSDIRNHPAASLVKSSFPIVVSSDDPVIWNALPLTHDFYAAFMAIGGNSADLRFVKQLVLNSLNYSTMSEKARTTCALKVQRRWNKAVKDIIFDNLPNINVV